MRLDFSPSQFDIRVHMKWGHNQIKYQVCSFDFSTLCKDRTGRFFKANSTLQWSSYSSSYLQGPFIHAHSITLSECIAHLDVWTVEITSQDYHVIYDQPPFFLFVSLSGFICITQGRVSTDSALEMKFASSWLSALQAVEGILSWE